MIVNEKRLEENNASLYFYQILEGLNNLHKNNIVHRNIKLENLLLDSTMKHINIIDFGLSKNIKNVKLNTPCGSPSYASPEMIKNEQYCRMKNDKWSLGIILYVMIFGSLQYEDKNDNALFEKIINREVKFKSNNASN